MIAKASNRKNPIDSAYIGTAGWNASGFPGEGSHLQIYSQYFNAVEINSSFYKNHLCATYERWRETVPQDFRFSVKLSKQVTHLDRLNTEEGQLRDILQGVAGLREKWGVLLIQTPPSLAFESKTLRRFLNRLRKCSAVSCVLEPRHQSWFNSSAHSILNDFGTEFADVDPAPVAELNSNSAPFYFRLHGSPKMYRSSYSKTFLRAVSKRIQHAQTLGKKPWCIFDNTTLGHATRNAQTLQTLLAT